MTDAQTNPSNLPPHLQGLNEPQTEAAKHFTGPILILAGAGSGKTRVLTRRVANLVLTHNVHPRNILAVTFTNKATEEMRARLNQILGAQARDLWVATFHSACLRILRHNAHLLGYTNDFVVYDDNDCKTLMKSLVKEQGLDEKKNPPESFLRTIDWCKNNFESPEMYAKRAHLYDKKVSADIYDQYQRSLLKANAMDFGDLLYNTVDLLNKHPQVLSYFRSLVHFILVDEFQDTNKVQYMLVNLLAAPRNNLLVVGDDDQSIYKFRGATIQNILNFERDFPGAKAVRLEQNYRSTQNILALANSVIESNKQRMGKKLWSAGDKGELIDTAALRDENEEAKFVVSEIKSYLRKGVSAGDIAIFYRTNAQSRALEEQLGYHGVAYRIFGGLKFYDRKEIKDVLAYLRLIKNPSDASSFLRVVNTPPRGLGPQAIAQLTEISRSRSLSLFEAARLSATQSKGCLEFTKLIGELSELSQSVKPSALIDMVLDRTGYRARLKDSSDPQNESRLENIVELQSVARQIEFSTESAFQALSELLDRVALTAGSDLPVQQDGSLEHDPKSSRQAVSLMTLHLAKGLEFPLVFLTGLEEGILPHSRSLKDPNDIEEERRLCYVGITRAMKKLYLTRAFTRGFSAAGGASPFREASRFALDMPHELLKERFGSFLGSSDGFIDTEVSSGGSSNYRFGGYGSDRGDWRYNRDSSSSRYGDDRASDNNAQRRDLRDGTKAKVWNSEKPASIGKMHLQRKLAAKNARLSATTASLLKTADQIQGSSKVRPTNSEAMTGPIAPADQLVSGTRVRHPTFGKGTISSREDDRTGDPLKLKLTVIFDASEEPKKFIYKFAKLALDSDLKHGANNQE